MQSSRMRLMVAIMSTSAMISAGAMAQIYKSTDKDGNVVYSDAPKAAGAKAVTLPVINTVQGKSAAAALPSNPPSHALAPLEVAPSGYQLDIVSPRPEASIPAAQVDLPVVVSLAPGLNPDHTLVYSLNGERLLESGSSSVVLNNPPRGSVTLQVEIFNEMGDVIGASEPRVVHLLRFPPRPSR